MLLSSLLFYKLFFRKIKIGCNKKSIAPVVEAKQANENKFLPEVNFYIVPLLISGGLFVLLILFFYFTFASFETMTWYEVVTKMSWYYLLGILFVLVLLVYYFVWQNWLAIVWVKKNKEKYYIYIGKDGIVRSTYFFWVFIPWEIIDGAEFEKGLEYTQGFDQMSSFKHLKINIKGHKIFTPNFIKGHGGGSMFDDWVEYGDEDMRAIEKLINQHT